VTKFFILFFFMTFSFLFGDDNVQVRLENGQKTQGEFIGTYMNHVHILVGENIYYYACDDIISIKSTKLIGKVFEYDCSINTVTADILFPPVFDPMTGEMTQMLPDVFNPDIPKPAVEKATPVVQKPTAKVEAGGVSAAEDFVVIDGVKYARVAPEKETAQADPKAGVQVPALKPKRTLFGTRWERATYSDAGSAPKFNACYQAGLDAVEFTSPLWYVGGIIYYVGVPAYFLSKPQPNHYAISNIAPEEQLLYLECYKTAAKNERGKRMALGCGGMFLFFIMTAGI
jgi:hypothetical protein